VLALKRELEKDKVHTLALVIATVALPDAEISGLKLASGAITY
jgi:hypothetical protein